jgi:peptide/nickel transport system permease protein
MSEPAATTRASAPAAKPPRSFAARVMLDTIGRFSARIGLLWIGIIAVSAVFAPFIANSHPYLLKADGEWSSPLWRHLSGVDLILVFAVLAALVLFLVPKVRFGHRVLALLGAVVIVTPLALYLKHPPAAVVYEQYREWREEGRVDYVLHAPIPFSPMDRLRDQPEKRFVAPSWEHLMGTEIDGADVFSRMIHASRIAMAVGFIATGIALVIGVFIGGMMGFFARWIDLLGMRLVEIFSAIPTIYLLLTFVAFFERNIYLIMVIIGLTGWQGYALFTRAEFLKLRQQDFVQAAIAAGLPLRSVLFRHMLPNGMAPVLVNASFGVASAILAESTLSFLGLGLIDEPSWGNLLNQALGVGGTFYWWIAFYPGLAIFLTVFAYNLVGEALRDAIDPHTQRQG